MLSLRFTCKWSSWMCRCKSILILPTITSKYVMNRFPYSKQNVNKTKSIPEFSVHISLFFQFKALLYWFRHENLENGRRSSIASTLAHRFVFECRISFLFDVFRILYVFRRLKPSHRHIHCSCETATKWAFQWIKFN